MRRASLAPIILLASCAGTGVAHEVPTPYTAEEIRDANPTGTVRVYRIQQEGSPTLVQTMTFVHADAGGARVESRTTTESGEPFGSVTTTAAPWTELRDHAAFPPELTQRARASCRVPAGGYDCWLYTVAGEDAGTPTLSRFWFAPETPGPPVLMEIESGGNITFRMELLAVRNQP